MNIPHSTPSTGAEPAWFHIVLTTYGSWLYGDERGFRTRRHREHVEGDYKHPPAPGRYHKKATQSRASLKQDPVDLSADWQAVIGAALVERLIVLGALVLCCAVSSHHVHVLAKIPRRLERDWTARAKRHAWFKAREHGWRDRLWAQCCRAERIESRRHQLNVDRYILRHAEQGAWVWRRRAGD